VLRWDLFNMKLLANAGVGGSAGFQVRRTRCRTFDSILMVKNYLNRVRPGEEFAYSVIRH
jgi:hypothetical protein